MNKFTDEIEKLAKRAADDHGSADALRFSQAALNLANTASTQVMANINEKQEIV